MNKKEVVPYDGEPPVSIEKRAPAPRSTEDLIAMAIQSGTSVESLEKLLAMKERMDAKIAKEAFNADMAEFQNDCPVIAKNRSVEGSYKYATLDSIISQVKGLLKEHGFSYAIQTETGDNKVKITCVAKHIAGHSESSSVEVPLGTKTRLMSDTQVVAAAMTFAKRYAFCNAFGILTGDEDSDAHKKKTATNATTPTSSAINTDSLNNKVDQLEKANENEQGEALMTEPQKRKIFALAKEAHSSNDELHIIIKKDFDIESFKQMTKDQAGTFIEYLQGQADIQKKNPFFTEEAGYEEPKSIGASNAKEVIESRKGQQEETISAEEAKEVLNG
jgi:hypothetical protein